MNDKTLMQYRVITARNPKTGGTLLRPVITNRNTMNMKQLVAYAKNAGYVRGQTKDLEGLLGLSGIPDKPSGPFGRLCRGIPTSRR